MIKTFFIQITRIASMIETMIVPFLLIQIRSFVITSNDERRLLAEFSYLANRQNIWLFSSTIFVWLYNWGLPIVVETSSGSSPTSVTLRCPSLEPKPFQDRDPSKLRHHLLYHGGRTWSAATRYDSERARDRTRSNSGYLRRATCMAGTPA